MKSLHGFIQERREYQSSLAHNDRKEYVDFTAKSGNSSAPPSNGHAVATYLAVTSGMSWRVGNAGDLDRVQKHYQNFYPTVFRFSRINTLSVLAQLIL